MQRQRLTPLGEAITLEQMLAARDSRAARHSALAAAHPDKALLAVTVVAPGPYKRTLQSIAAGNAAFGCCLSRFADTILSARQFDLSTGYEADLLLDMSREEAKRIAIDIEETHTLGRLFDLDIIDPDGRPLSRRDAGLPERSCLVCGRPARECMRAATHSRAEVQARIASLVADFLSPPTNN